MSATTERIFSLRLDRYALNWADAEPSPLMAGLPASAPWLGHGLRARLTSEIRPEMDRE
jgi:hypothetical protein